jgi:hypothetical protein
LFASSSNSDAGLQNFARGFTGTEARQADLLSDLGKSGVYVSGKVSLIHKDRELDFVAFEGFTCRLHRVPSVSARWHRGPTKRQD